MQIATPKLPRDLAAL